MLSKKTATVALATAGLIALPSAAFADTVDMAPQSVHDVAGSTETFTVQLLEDGGNSDPVAGCNASTAAPVRVDFTSDDVWATTTPGFVSFTECNVEQTVTINIAANAPADANTKIYGIASGGAQDVPIVVRSKHPVTNRNVETTQYVDSGYKDDFLVLHIDPPVVNEEPPPGDNPPPNPAPTLTTPAPDVTDGLEGSQMSTSGAFSDTDDLTIRVLSGSGVVQENATNGSYTWTLTPGDQGSGTVVIEAEDTAGQRVTDSFDWAAANVAPTITSSTATLTAACAATVTTTATDPAGPNDTLTTLVTWADGTTGASKTFTTAGTHTATVTVSDEDGGTSAPASPSVTAKNTVSSILAPINTSGSRSSFKQGSTIPVKVTVTDCANSPVSTLLPQVNMTTGDTVPDFPVNEEVITLSATNGKQMRWSDTQYIYNLSTKLNQFTGGVLSGTFTVAVSDPSFYNGPVSATFDVRK